ncbi:MAG: ribosome small subunit-dependent GTPase, partial [Candidatus Margulisiibacteriota bacterium]
MLLAELGWGPNFEENFQPFREQGLSALRITREDRGKYSALGEAGEFCAEISGKFRYGSDGKASFPAVGDWV